MCLPLKCTNSFNKFYAHNVQSAVYICLKMVNSMDSAVKMFLTALFDLSLTCLRTFDLPFQASRVILHEDYIGPVEGEENQPANLNYNFALLELESIIETYTDQIRYYDHSPF